jgi:hypothetical protein
MMAEDPENESTAAEPAAPSTEATPAFVDATPEAPVVPDDLVPDVPADEEPSRPANPVLAIVVGVLAVALVASAAYFGFTTLSGGASDSRARVETAIAFTEAMLTQDTAGIKKSIPSDALKKVTDAQWAALEQSAGQPAVAYQKVTWSGDTATVKLAAAGQDGLITAKADPRATDTVTLSLSGKAFGETVPGACVLVHEGSAWKVVAFTIGTTTLKFDAANISNTMGSEAATGTP